MYFVSLYATWQHGLLGHLWQLHHCVFSDSLLSCVGGDRGHRRLIPVKLWNDEKYSNPHYNSLLPMSVHARETRYTLNKEFVSYLRTYSGREMQFTPHTRTVSDVHTSLYNIRTLLCSRLRSRNSCIATEYV